MLRTRFTELFGIEVPVLQAAIWPATTPELVAAVSGAGGLGTIASIFASADDLRRQIGQVRDRTDAPFVVNHVVPSLDDDAFQATLDAAPAGISFALGDPGDRVEAARSAGLRVIHQVHTIGQAREAAGRGVDAVIAQGSEAGGQGMVAGPSVMALAPQVVDAVAPIPVLAAGGIADGRGLAAALALGAAGANVGTRFLASREAGIDDAWRARILETESEETVRFETWSAIMPPSGGGYDVVPRVIRTEFVSEWERPGELAEAKAGELRAHIMASVMEGRPHEVTPFAGQSVGLIDDVLPAGEIVERIAAQAREALDAIDSPPG